MVKASRVWSNGKALMYVCILNCYCSQKYIIMILCISIEHQSIYVPCITAELEGIVP